MSLKVYPMTNTGLFGLLGCESGFRGSDIFIIAKSASGSAHLEDVEAGEDVFMFEEPHHLELPEDALTADEALKNVG